MEFVPEAALFNENGHLKPQAAQQMAILFFEREVVEQNISVPVLIKKYGVSWVLLSMTIECSGEVHPGVRLHAALYASSRNGIVFRNDVRFLDERGQAVLIAALFVTVLDVKTRHVCRDEVILSSLERPGAGLPRIEAVSRPAYRAADFVPVHRREVYPSWMDEVGHVGNVRYGEMAYDALSEERRAELGTMKRYEITFMRELHRGDIVELRRFDEPDASSVLGVRVADGQEIFLTRFRYGGGQG